MNNKINSEITNGLLTLAKENMESAKVLLNTGLYKQAGFHVQQAIEIGIKAEIHKSGKFLEYHERANAYDTYPMGHRLCELRDIALFKQIPLSLPVSNDYFLKSISKWESNCRYDIYCHVSEYQVKEAYLYANEYINRLNEYLISQNMVNKEKKEHDNTFGVLQACEREHDEATVPEL